jgi:hypothetical protein
MNFKTWKPTKSQSKRAESLREYLNVILRIQGTFTDKYVLSFLSFHSKNTIISARKYMEMIGVIKQKNPEKKLKNNQKLYHVKDFKKANELLIFYNDITLSKLSSKFLIWGKQKLEDAEFDDLIFFENAGTSRKVAFVFPKNEYLKGRCPLNKSHKLRNYHHGKRGQLIQSHPMDRKCIQCKLNFTFGIYSDYDYLFSYVQNY